MPRLLLIEDDSKTAAAVGAGLDAEGYEVAVARDGTEGSRRLDAQAFDLIVLDWMLPGRDGMQILCSLRARGREPPVLLLTARDAVEDRVKGLDAGADDYLVKPFAFAELLARIRALLRRTSPEEPARSRFADLTIEAHTRRVLRGSRDILLTPREFDLFVYLVRHMGEVVTRPMLARDVWREASRATPLDNVIDVHLANLRRKIDAERPHSFIQTLRGVGFVLRENPPT
ncbi:MAG TPA: response regulator transcription factor [Steroidobacteraceae bacterium]|nr:response regulator transcription factor [Steroidobacteraceae bacterium]